MIVIGEDKQTIYLTRGDATSEFYRLAFYFPVWNFTTNKEERYSFKPTDKITFIVSTKKGYTKVKVFQTEHTLKEMGYFEPTEYPELVLTKEDSDKFDMLDKKKTYWYELILNDTTTMIGHTDDEGAAKIVLLPSGKER